MERPVGVAKYLRGQAGRDQLGGANDLIGLCGFGDHAYGAGGDARPRGEWSRSGGPDSRGPRESAGRDDCRRWRRRRDRRRLLHESGEGDGLGEVPGWAEGFGSPVGCGDPDE